MSYSPIKKFYMLEKDFTAFKPKGHLWRFILSIGNILCILCKINVKALSIFNVAVVCCAIEFDVHNVVVEEVKFGDVEIFMYPQIDEDVFIIVESLQGIIK